MDTRQLQSFLEIVEAGSISRAAKALGLAQPSLSQQLLRLEDEVGFKLFRRTPRGVTTTEAGRLFQEHAQQIVHRARAALEDVRQLEGEPAGEVVFAMPHSVLSILSVRLVEAVRKHTPGISLRLVEGLTGHVREWLQEGSVDLAILHDRGRSEGITAEQLAHEEMLLVGPPGAFGPLPENEPTDSEELANFPLILPSRKHGLRQFLDREAERIGIELDIALEIDAESQIARLVAEGLGYSIMSLDSALRQHARGRVSITHIGYREIQRTLWLAQNPGRIVTRASLRIEDLTINLAAQMIGKGLWPAEPGRALRQLV